MGRQNVKWLHRHKYLVLVITLACLFIVQSVVQSPLGFSGGPVISESLAALITLAVFLVVFERHFDRVLALCVFVAIAASSWARYVLPAALLVPLTITHYILLTLFLGYAVAVILRNIFRKGAVGADDVLGAVSGYLIAAGAWSSLYALTDVLVPGSYTVAPGLVTETTDWHGRTALFNYFSMVTLTTMGYGDVTPARAPATALAMLEAVFGQFYIAVVVAQLVGARLADSTPAESRN